MAGYYRRFIKEYAKIAYSLHRLLRLDATWIWDEECIIAFNKLKQCLISEPVLIYPDYSQPMILETDASLRGLGVILSQKREGKLYLIAYASRS